MLRSWRTICAFGILMAIAGTTGAGEPNVEDSASRSPLRGLAVWDRLQAWKMLPGQGDATASVVANPICLRVSSRFLAEWCEQTIDREVAITDEILGTKITGAGRTQGDVRLVLVPDDDEGVIEIVYAGTMNSQTQGVHSPVVLHNKAHTVFEIRKRMVVAPQGLTILPQSSAAETHSETTDIETKLPGLRGQIARRVAANRVAQLRAQADSIAAEHTLATIDREFTERLTSATQPREGGLVTVVMALCGQENFAGPRYRTTDNFVEVSLWRTTDAAMTSHPRPEITQDADLVLCIHRQSAEKALGDPKLHAALMPLMAVTLETTEASRPGPAAVASRCGRRIEWSADGQWLMVELRLPQRLAE